MPAYKPMPLHLETERLRLQPWTESDADELRVLHSERGNGTPTVERAREIIAKQLAATAASGIALLPIRRRDEGDFIGYCGLIVGRSTVEEPEIAYELLQRAHGRGYLTEGWRGARCRDSDRAETALVDCRYMEHAIVPCP
jgi:RimJ/RimL family protein N-acetyltransferase